MLRDLPGDEFFFANVVPADGLAHLTPGWAEYASARFGISDIVASTASHPNVRDDRDTPLVEEDETTDFLQMIWVVGEAEYF